MIPTYCGPQDIGRLNRALSQYGHGSTKDRVRIADLPLMRAHDKRDHLRLHYLARTNRRATYSHEAVRSALRVACTRIA